jgi:glycosyltransferase involved in cell wall biosynthesis
MKEKIKILVIPSDKSGCGYFRSVQPHKFIAENYSDKFKIDIIYELPQDQPLDKFLQQYDILHIHKQLDKECKVISLAQFLGLKVIVDVDDYWDLGNDHPMSLSAKQQNWKAPIIAHVQQADYVTTTTEIFKNTIKPFNKNVLVFPNAIDPTEEQFIPKPTYSDKLRFGIICGSSHEKDIEILKGVVASLPQDVIDQMQIVLCGFDVRGTVTMINPQTNETKTRDIQPQESVWYRYEQIVTNNYKITSPQHTQFLHMFMPQVEYPNINESYRRCWTKDISEYATHYNNIDVLLVPLKENKFNAQKSQLKVIECGFFNKAIIAQNFGPYQLDLVPMIEKGGNINENGNALLVDSSKNHKLWAKYITRLVRDRSLVKKLQENLHNTVKDKYCLKTVCEQRVKEYLKMMGRE